MIYVKVNGTLYPASISGRMDNKQWDGRESKCITIQSTFATVDALFPDGVAWSIVDEHEVPAAPRVISSSSRRTGRTHFG